MDKMPKGCRACTRCRRPTANRGRVCTPCLAGLEVLPRPAKRRRPVAPAYAAGHDLPRVCRLWMEGHQRCGGGFRVLKRG